MKPVTKKHVDESIILNKGDVEQTTEKKDIHRKPRILTTNTFGTTDLTFFNEYTSDS